MEEEHDVIKELVEKIVIIIVGSVIAAYGITLALYAGFGGATLQFCGRVFQKHFI